MSETNESNPNNGNTGGEVEVKKSKKVSDAELDDIIDRLYTQQVNRQKEKEKNSDNKREKKDGKTEEEVNAIVDRLYHTKTKAMEDDPSKRPVAEDQISKKKVSSGDLDNIIERLHTTHTKSSGADNKPKKLDMDTIAKKGLSEDEIKAIYDRLVATHTISSSGGKKSKISIEEPKEPGLGLKMLPIIEGLDTRFKGKQLTDEQAAEIMQRLLTTQTGSSQAKRDFPKILLYPERTILHNCTSRIKAYQDSGSMSKQKELARREKWFN